MLEAAIAASLQEFHNQRRESSSQSGPSDDKNDVYEIASKSPSKGSSPVASPSKLRNQPKRSPQTSPLPRSQVVDLTNDSDSDSDVKENFPKSKSVVSSETSEEPVGDVGDDYSDDDLKRAIAMSLEGSQHGVEVSGLPGPTSPRMPTKIAEAADTAIPKPQGIFGIDRKQMEQERLARLAKRKAESSPPLNQPAPKASKITTHQPISTAQASSTQRASLPRAYNNSATRDPGVQPTAQPLMQYPLGVVKKTHVASKLRTGNDITIEEVFQRADLNVAVLSSFMWDIEWLFSKFDTRKTRFILMMGAKEEATVSKLVSSILVENPAYMEVAQPVSPGDSIDAYSRIVLPADGTTSQQHAFETHTALPSRVPTSCRSDCKSHPSRLGREWPHGKCKYHFFHVQASSTNSNV